MSAIPKINWRTWSAEALDAAEREGRPVLLSITATWCHWCHVMDATAFADDRVAQLVNSRFIAVRADADRRPDLNARYNMGGWPTVAFLTPSGDIITGATYLPPRQMTDLLNRVAEVYGEERADLAARAAEARARRQEELARAEESTALLTEHISQSVIRTIEGTFDPVHGGFGTQRKFPHVSALELLLTHYRRTGSRTHLDMAARTLDAMKAGGIYDPVEGGFFRYSTTRDWSIPHYEKMLEDNSGLAAVYVQAYSVTDDERYLETARSVMRYLENTLLDERTKAFFGSQDADEEYYALSKADREKRAPPSVDRVIYANWNGLAADAYLMAFEATADRRYLDRGLGVLDFLLTSCRHDGAFYHYWDGEPREAGMLADQVHVGRALVSAYECTGRRTYLDAARDAAEHIRTQFLSERGALCDITEQRWRAERLPYREEMLDDNALAARFLNRLSYYAFEPAYRFAAEAALRLLTRSYGEFGVLASPYALAVIEVLEEPVRVAIAGPLDDPRTERLLSSTLRAKQPSSLVQLLDAESDADEMREFGLAPSGEPQAAVCIADSCRVAGDPSEVVQAIKKAEERHWE